MDVQVVIHTTLWPIFTCRAAFQGILQPSYQYVELQGRGFNLLRQFPTVLHFNEYTHPDPTVELPLPEDRYPCSVPLRWPQHLFIEI